MSEVASPSVLTMHDANTPVQTPSSENFTHGSMEEKYALLGDKESYQEPEKPLSPPNPSPSPEKHRLDEDEGLDSAEKKPKLEGAETSNGSTDTTVSALGPGQPPLEPAPKPPAEPDMNNLPENPMPKHQAKYALNTLRSVKRLRDAHPFVNPVDTVKLNIPLYYNYIPRPMDLSTIERKINVNAYEEPTQVLEDFNLMVNNCLKFNGQESGISKMAKNILAYFEKHMLNMPPKILSNAATTSAAPTKRVAAVEQEAKTSVGASRPRRVIHPPKSKELPYDVRPRKKKNAADIRFCNQTIKEVMAKKYYNFNFPFLAPVDPVALNIPKYFDVVKEPMDLGTIQSNLSNNQYDDGDQFERDVRLVFSNCYKFNPEGSEVNIMGHKLEAIFDKKWGERPLPEPTPPPLDSEVSSDEEDMESNDALLSNVPAIQFLENQLIRMKKELDELKQQHLAKIKQQRDAKKKKKKLQKKSNKSSSTRASYSEVLTPVVTYEMKKQISESVPSLSDKKLSALIKIIKDDVDISNEDEVELDMDQLEDRTVLKLYNFLFAKKASAGLKKKKSQPYSNSEELESLRSQLALFEDVDGHGRSQMKINNNDDQSSDDDMSSESSEEE